MLSKEELKKMAESKTTDYAAIYEKEIGTNLPSLHFKGGFNCAVDVLWPEIERLRNEIESTNALFVKHSREYQDQVADLERKLVVAKEALRQIGEWPSQPGMSEKARTALKEIEGEK